MSSVQRHAELIYAETLSQKVAFSKTSFDIYTYSAGYLGYSVFWRLACFHQRGVSIFIAQFLLETYTSQSEYEGRL